MAKLFVARRLSLLVVIVGWLASAAAGCAKNNQPGLEDIGQVKGTVTCDGKPVVHGAVEFYRNGVKTCVAAIDKDGTYQTPLLEGAFKVAIVTRIEPREVARLVREGPAELVGTPGGKAPERLMTSGKPAKTIESDDRIPTLAALLEQLPPADRDLLEAVQKRYADPATSGLSVTVQKGNNTQNFVLAK
jgi:hypothetical protein